MKPKSKKHCQRDRNDWMRGNYKEVILLSARWWRSERRQVKRLIEKEITPPPSNHRKHAHWWL